MVFPARGIFMGGPRLGHIGHGLKHRLIVSTDGPAGPRFCLCTEAFRLERRDEKYLVQPVMTEKSKTILPALLAPRSSRPPRSLFSSTAPP